jgi:phenylacetate-CoA ligase
MPRIEQPLFAALLQAWPGKYRALRRARHFPYKLPDEIREIQWSALKRLLNHAWRSVPYYRRVFGDLGITPAEIRTPEDFRRLPPLTKDEIRAHLPEFKTRRDLGDRIFLNHTGGSTGQPLAFYQHEAYRRHSGGMVLRGWSWAGWRPASRLAWIWGAPRETSGAASLGGRLRFWLQRMKMFDAFHMSAADLDHWLDVLMGWRPEYLNGYVSSLCLFADHIRQRGAKVSGIRGVFTTAERLLPEQRALLGEVFGTKVYDAYGSREIMAVANECPRGRMHIHADAVYVESVPGRGGDHLLVTPLHNYAMPLIRYDMGDHGRLRDGRCDCGINLPLMEMEIGRVFDHFVFPDGRVVHGQYFTSLMFGIEGVQNFQFRQTRRDEIRLYVTRSRAADERTAQEIDGVAAAIRAELGGAVTVLTEFVDEIPPTAAGKHRFTISEVPRE